MSTEEKGRRLRRLVPSWSFLTRQRFLLEKQKKMLERSHKFAANYRPFSSFSTLFYPAEACFFPDFFLAVRPARLMIAARAATRAQPTRPETEVPAALSLPAKL